MSDLIDRQSVLNAFDYWVKSPMIGYTNGLVRLREMFEELPPVMQEPCTDAISRQAVLEIIRKCHCEEWVKADIGAPIEALQSVTPAEKVGHWVSIGDFECRCSECHLWCYKRNRSRYCPSCGAKMGGEQNETDD